LSVTSTLPSWLSFNTTTGLFTGTPSNVNVGNLSVTVRATDASTTFAEDNFVLSVLNTNDAPSLDQGIDDQDSTEDLSFSITVPSDAFADPDAGDSLSYTLVSGPAWLSLSGNTLSGTPAQSDVGEASVTLRATDSSTLSNDANFLLRVAEVNDNAPVLTSATVISVEENTIGTVYTATATDADTLDTLAFSITGGADAALFSLDASTGVLSFVSTPDFESSDDAGADRTYELVLTATDSASQTSNLTLRITVLDANDVPPSFSSATTHSVPEDQGSTGYVATATDPDTLDALAFAIVAGPDAAHFNIDSATGLLSFAHPLDFETPLDADTDNTYSLVLRARDAADNDTLLNLDVVLQDSNDTSPTFTSPASVSISEDNYTVDYTAVATDPDSDDAPALSLRYRIDGGADAALFNITESTGVLAFTSAPDFENPDDAGADHVYDVRLKATDNANNTTLFTLSIALTDANDNAPNFSSAPHAEIPEGSTNVFYTATATDPDTLDAVNFSLSAGNEAGLFTLNASTGALSVSAVDFEQPGAGSANNVYTLTLLATDSASHSKAYLLAVTVEDINDNAPVFTSSTAVTVDENTTGTLYTATATDPDTNDTLSWAFGGGADDALFSLNSSTGALNFLAPPNAETPLDTGGNNIYNITLRALDGAANSSDLTITVTVDNDHAPVFSSAPTASVSEGSTATFYAAQASDTDSGDTISYTLSGADAALFTLDSSSGALQLRAPADFEHPSDSNNDRSFALTLRATDTANNLTEQSLNVALTDVNEAPAAPPQSFTVGEFADSGTAVGSLIGTDPENNALHWTLLTIGSPFALSDNGTLSVSDTLDFESITSYPLSVTLSDGLLESTVMLSIVLLDENEITHLLNHLPTDVQALIAEGVTSAVVGREPYYNNALTAANPQPTTSAQLQGIIDAANATAEIVDGASTGTGSNGMGSTPSTLITQLIDVGISHVEPTNAAAYEQAIEHANPAPTTADLQAFVNAVNTVAAAKSLNSSSGSTDSAALASALSALSTVPTVPHTLLSELAALIDRAQPRPSTEAEIASFATTLLNRSTDHPVLWLSLEQDGEQVQQVRIDGGHVTITVHLANSVPGIAVNFDWSQSNALLLTAASVANPVTQSFSFDPSALVPGQALQVFAAVTRSARLADGQMVIPVAPIGTATPDTQDSDGDGVHDVFEGELEASIDPSVANRLQTVRGDDFHYVMESSPGITLRLGSVARRAQLNQSRIALNDIQVHLSGVSAAQFINGLPSDIPANDLQIFDFEAATLPHAGASALLVLPLPSELRANAHYLKFHPATGWRAFVQDGLNRLSSAPALAGILGQCPPVGHSTYADGLIEGNACVQLRIEDGGVNDSDHWNTNGSIAADRGLNGNIKDPGAIVYITLAGLTPPSPAVITGVRGHGAVGLGWLGLIALLFVRRGCPATRRRPSAVLIPA